MTWTLLDLLQGTTPMFDAQALRDYTDDMIFAAGHQGYGVVSGSAPTISLQATTYTTASSGMPTLSSLTGSGVVTLTASPNVFPTGGGFFSVPTTGGGSATIGYTATSGSTFTGCTYLGGGSGSVSASATVTPQFILSLSASADIYNQWTSVALPAFGANLSLTAPGGGFAALPCSTSGDRKDMMVSTTGGTPSIVQGTACSQVDWTRNNGSYANPAPAKPAWSSSFPIVLTEIYVPGSGSTHGNTSIAAGNLTDKSLVLVKA